MNIVLAKKDRTASVTLERPPLNILNLFMLRELKAVLESLGGDGTVDFLVLRGGGERAFSAGVDVKDHTREKVPEMLEVVHGVIRRLLTLPQITIALVRGVCLGGGCELASSCDLILASEDSSFATPEIQVGCYPPVALARFPSQLGYHRAAEMILTGRRISSQEALAIGLINRAVPANELEQALEALLEELKGKSGAVLRIALRGLREISLKNFSEALE
ncbi:MAG: enoyl-CoA hydratase/isomerase family protein, partial [Candidatus Binatia bacterium]